MEPSKPLHADLDFEFTSGENVSLPEEGVEDDVGDDSDEEYLSAEDDNEETMDTD